LRIEYEGAFYHITARGNERKRIFFGKGDYDKFKEYLLEAQDKYGYRLHCYVLMGNHYHLVIETPNGNMNKVLHYINGSYANYINRKRNRSGHLLQGRYKGILVDRDAYLLELSRYLHLNPVRAKIVERPEDYRQSSYRSYVKTQKEAIVTTDLILGMVSEDGKTARRAYREYVEKGVAEGGRNPLEDVYGGVFLGSRGFIKQALRTLKETTLDQEEIAGRRELRKFEIEDVIEAVCSYFEVSADRLAEGGKDLRDMAIYLLKRHTSVLNRQIGELFEGLTYSGVSKANQRFSMSMSGDRSLRKAVEKIAGSMSNVKV
jgi:REP element-mobilizing transposase RayT